MSPGEIHFWLIERDQSADLALLGSWLSASERDRANRYKARDRRDSFIYHRAIVRQILADYSGLMPANVPLTTSPTGKPLWNAPAGGRSLTFNLSHRSELAILAVSRGRTIGIDLECEDVKTDYDAVARQMFSAREMTIYERLSCNERPQAVLRAWTRKEAFLKAVGTGLNRPVAEIEVTFCEEQPPQLLATSDLQQNANDWLLHSWSPRPGYVAAAAFYVAAAAFGRESDSPLFRYYSAASIQESECVAAVNEAATAALHSYSTQEH